MKIRKSHILKDQKESKKNMTLRVTTKFPEKWILVDTETCQIYNGTRDEKITKNWSPIKNNDITKKLAELIKKISEQ